MTIKVTELLKLFTKAKQLDLSVEVCEDKDGDYIVRIYEMFRPEGFDETVFINQVLKNIRNSNRVFGVSSISPILVECFHYFGFGISHRSKYPEGL